jgi:predicted DNA-binding transcriptional regulator AlpA
MPGIKSENFDQRPAPYPPTREIVRETARKEMTQVSRVQWWRLEIRNLAPKRVKLGANSVGWIRSELEGWIADRVKARDAGATR